jgi:hypothetical protein
MSWRKSSYSASGECTEVANWRKASPCEQETCVEVGHGPMIIGVRDTKDRRIVLEFSPDAWRRFTAEVKAS